MRLSINYALIRIIAFAFSIATVNGYILGRLITIKNDGELDRKNELNMPSLNYFTTVMENLNTPQFDDLNLNENTQNFVADATTNDSQNEIRLQKKGGPFEHYKKGLLKKYSGSGSRNCFFTPIQCMIQHDMSKYRKLVDSNIQIGRITRRSMYY